MFELMMHVPQDRRDKMLDAFDDATNGMNYKKHVFIFFVAGAGFAMIPSVK